MTKRTAPIIAILISSLFLASCTQATPPTQTTTETTEVKEESMVSSLRDLMAKGSSVKCTFSLSDDQTKSETKGTLYASGKRFAQTTEITLPNEKVAQSMNMISDGTYMYSWGNDAKTPGMKIKLDAQETTSTETKDQAAASIDKKMDMKCSAWSVDESKFTVPTNITFTDLSSMMENAKKMVPGKTPVVIPSNIPNIPSY